MYAANGASQHTLCFYLTVTGRRARSRMMVCWARTEKKTEKGAHQRPDSDDENKQEQKNNQNQFDEHVRSKKQSPSMSPAV